LKILVVRFKQIGDSILASPICNSLKKSFPNSQVDYVVYEHISPLFKSHPHIDNVISITKDEQKNVFKYIRKVRQITKVKYDIVIDIMSTPKSELFTLFSLKSKYRIGRYKKKRGYTYTHKIKEPHDAKDKVDKFLRMLGPLEEEYSIVYDSDYIISIHANEKEYMRNKMTDAGLDFSRPIFICAINSRVERKIYPINNMLEIVQSVINKFNAQVIFFYSPSEKDFALNAKKALNDDKNIFVSIETKSIRELAMLISNCNMFFGNEGGPRHLAQSLNIPSFSIFCKHSDKKEWLSNSNEFHQGVEPNDFVATTDYLSDREAYDLIRPDYVFQKISEIYKKI